MATEQSHADKGTDGASTERGDTLNLQDVLSGIPLEGAAAANLGIYLVFETVGNNTVISVDPDGPGHPAPVPILTLANVTGKTLQDVLNEIQHDV